MAEQSAALFDGLLTRVQALAGVEAAALTLGLPLDPRASFFVDESRFSIDGRAAVPAAERPSAPLHVVSPDYFSVIGVPLKRGRFFSEVDRGAAPGVVIINEAMARRIFPGRIPSAGA